jgi:hypothetical protein
MGMKLGLLHLGKRALQVFENRVLRRLKRDDVTRGCKKCRMNLIIFILHHMLG